MLVRRALLAVAVALALPSAADADEQVVVPYGATYDYRAVPVGGSPGFEAPAFATPGWASHAAPFGALSYCTGLPTPFEGGWGVGDLLLRHRFDVPAGVAGARLSVRVDNNFAVFLNGEPVLRRESDGCAALDPAPVALPPGALRAGENLLAVRATNDEDQSYIDVRLEADLDRFTVALAGASPAAGEEVTISAEISNRSTHPLTSVVLDPPPGLSLPAGAAVPVELGPGESDTVTFPVRASCDADGGAWSASAEGAVLYGPDSALTSPVSGECTLEFAAQPAGARVGTAITDAPFAPGGPVRVALLGAAGTPVEGAEVTVARAPAGTLGGDTTQAVSGGAAAFADLSIADAGDFRLVATAAGATPVESAPFPVEQVATPCIGGACFATIESPATTVDVQATTTDGRPGFLTLSLDDGPDLDCPRYRELTPDTVTIDGSPNLSEKRVTYTIAYDTLFAGWRQYGLSLAQLCFSAPYQFTPRAGHAVTQSPFDGDGDGTPETWNTALLPECQVLWIRNPPPCVAARRFTAEGIAVVARLPGGAKDPKMRG